MTDLPRRIAVITVTALTALALSVVLVAPATAAPAKTSVTLTTPKKAKAGATIAMTVSAKGAVEGQKVSLQLKSGKKWVTVATGKIAAPKKKLTVKTTAPVAGKYSYRALLAKKGAAAKAVSQAAAVKVSAATGTLKGTTVTVEVSSSTSSNVTKATISGTVKKMPAEAGLTIEIQFGAKPKAKKWRVLTTAPLKGSGAKRTFKTTVNIPFTRSKADNGAPLLHYRATVSAPKGSATSARQTIALKTVYEGPLYQYGPKDDYPRTVGTVYVDYSSNAFRMHFGANPVYGTTAKWDLVDNSKFRIRATRMAAGQRCLPTKTQDGTFCIGYADGPWIQYRATLDNGTLIIAAARLTS